MARGAQELSREEFLGNVDGVNVPKAVKKLNKSSKKNQEVLKKVADVAGPIQFDRPMELCDRTVVNAFSKLSQERLKAVAGLDKPDFVDNVEEAKEAIDTIRKATGLDKPDFVENVGEAKEALSRVKRILQEEGKGPAEFDKPTVSDRAVAKNVTLSKIKPEEETTIFTAPLYGQSTKGAPKITVPPYGKGKQGKARV